MEYIFTKLQYRIFRLLCVRVGNIFNQREMSKILSVSPTAISKSLSDLEKLSLIKVVRDKNVLIELNKNESTISFKRVENLKQIYESGITNFLEDKFKGCDIILFGSYSLGEDTINSDIDLAIIGTKETTLSLESFEKHLNRKIHLSFFEKIDNIPSNFLENINKGIPLSLSNF